MAQDAISSQCAQIKAHLQSGRSITPMEALDLYGCFRLGARIYDLRRAGLEIETDTKSAVNRFGKKVRFAVYRFSDFSDFKSGNSEGEFSCLKQENLAGGEV